MGSGTAEGLDPRDHANTLRFANTNKYLADRQHARTTFLLYFTRDAGHLYQVVRTTSVPHKRFCVKGSPAK